MSILIDAASSKGSIKRENQDRCIVNDMIDSAGADFFWIQAELMSAAESENWGMAALCDGVTHSVHPCWCTEEYLKVLQESYFLRTIQAAENREDIRNHIDVLLKEGRKRLMFRMNHAGLGRNAVSASTLSLVLFQGNQLCCYNLGDSPVFLLRDGNMEEISRAQTDVVNKNIITGFVSNLPLTREGECSWHELREGDIILLCSDGITKGISLETIKEVVYEKDMPALELVEMAEKRSADNLTAVVIQNGLHLASE